MIEISDKELFESASADTPAVVETPETPVVEAAVNDGPVRDEQGRFASKEVTPETVAEAPAQPVAAPTVVAQQEDRQGWVPSGVHREEKEARRQLERDMQEMRAGFDRQMAQFRQQQQPREPATPPPSIFEDPDGYTNRLESTFQERLAKVRFDNSEDRARDKFGDAKVDEVKQWVNERNQTDPGISARILNARHPYGEMVKIFDEQKTLSEIGTDPAAYRQKILDEAMKDQTFVAKIIETVRQQGSGQPATQTQPTNLVQLPPSINRATSAASPHEEAGSMSDASLYASTRK